MIKYILASDVVIDAKLASRPKLWPKPRLSSALDAALTSAS